MKQRKARRVARTRGPAGVGDSELLRTAQSYLAEGRADFASMILERAVAAEPQAMPLRLALAQAHSRLGQWQECENQCNTVLAAAPMHPEAWVTLTEALLLQGRRGAVKSHLQGLSRVKAEASQLARLGTLCLEHGFLEQAQVALERAFTQDPKLPGLALELSRVVRFDEGQRPLIARMQGLMGFFAHEPLLLADVHFALGKAYEDLAELQLCAGHYIKGNQLVAGTVHFDKHQHAQAVDAIIETFDSDLIARLARSGSRSQCPILIVGMPRSGTTLVEQVLAAHPEVAAGGECSFLDDIARGLKGQIGSSDSYPRCVAQMTPEQVECVAASYLEKLQSLHPGATRITDKMPTNFLHLGLAAGCLPGARIVHCTRSAQDTAVSLYFQQFSAGNDWTYRVGDIAAFYAQYERVMRHWQALAAEVGDVGTAPRIFNLAYEDLVRERERCVRALLEFLGLAWDEACLAHDRGNAAVRTASNWQVRQPIHTASVGRSERFALYLPQLLSAMQSRNGDD